MANILDPQRKIRNWELEILPFIKQQLIEFQEQGIKPTLRTIFYRLASKNIINFTQGDYTYLSDFTSKCRKRHLILQRTPLEKLTQGDYLSGNLLKILKQYGLVINYKKSRVQQDDIVVRGVVDDYTWTTQKYIIKTNNWLPIDCFADETRGVIQDFIDDFETPNHYIKDKLDFLFNLAENYKYFIPKWHDQPYYVEVWTEKNAMVGTLRSILKGLDVRIVYNRGFDSISNTRKTFLRLKKAWQQEKKVRIFYLGDLDPSGDAMDETMRENLNVFFNVDTHESTGDYSFKRIAILYEHIERFKLKENPDEKVLKKLADDPRKESFKAKYGIAPGKETDNKLFQIEIDALAAADPVEFKKMVTDEIESCFDPDIYEGVLSNPEYSESQISGQVMKNVQKYIGQENIKSFMESTF
ncbi:MAG TPA: hypothetical protein VD710_09445 [Nitrososphaeraceae archaeon]|nr:hypothetical protein [Nitrososphaeraceae archaeon]